MQRQYNIGLNIDPGTISLAVDNNTNRLAKLRGPERVWPKGSDITITEANRYGCENNKCLNKGPPPKYSPAFTSDVSHLVV